MGQRLRRIILLCLMLPLSVAAETAFEADTLYVFWSEDCPHCREQKLFLESLQQSYPELRVIDMELSRSDRYHQLFRQMAAARGITSLSVPTVFFNDHVWVGASALIERQIRQAVASVHAPATAVADETAADGIWFGGLQESEASILLLTALIALVDGFNPCSLWVLTLLLALVINSGSRRRIALVGGTFLLTTALIYGAFVAGVFSVLSFLLYLQWVQWLVAGFALFFGLVNVKDYFWYKRGLSFTIAESQKPGIYRGLRRLRQENLGGIALILATVLMAAGIAVVELPCTAGFPVLWSSIISERGVAGGEFALLLGVYVLVYLLIELLVFGTALLTLRMERFEERHGRLLKLYGGMIMLALAGALVLKPDLMGQLQGSLLLFGGAFLAASLIVLLTRSRATSS